MKTIFVIFGATGDLAKRKLFPVLYNIYKKQSTSLNIIGVGRRDLNKQTFQNFLDKELNDFIDKGNNFGDFLSNIEYSKVELNEKSDYLNLEKDIKNIQGTEQTQIIFYLSISPEYFGSFVDNYKSIDLKNTKIIFEKPFGTDLQTARDLNEKIMEIFNEKQVYRIDHYVGKEAVQNILAFRFANIIFEPIWNNKYIDNIQITASESIGVGDRGGYYDNSGALRDMVQNHLFQVLSLIVMDSPSMIDADGIRQEKLKVLKSLNLGKDLEKNIIFGQYEGYKTEKGVPSTSNTETFVAMKLEVNTWNFSGVPIYLRTGKKMKQKSTLIVIEFKDIPDILFKKFGKIERNRVILEVQPNEAIDIHFNIKENGNSKEVQKVRSKFSKEIESKEAYEKLIEDIILGDKTLFTSWNMLEESWKVVENLINCKNNCPLVFKYETNNNGPKESYHLLEKDGKKWYE